MQNNQKITTDTLLGRLFRTSSFEQFKLQNSDELRIDTLPEYLTKLCEDRGETHESIILRSGIDRVYGHQIFCGRKRPSRDKVLQLAFGFKMCDKEAQELLKVAGKSRLYPRAERDAAILFCLYKGKSFVETQCVLSEMNLPILGRGDRRE